MPKTTWESRRGFERLHGFADTAAAILINPRSFFGVIGPTREWFLPTLFGYICVMIGTAAALAWQILLVPEFAEVMDEIVTQLGVSRDTAVSLLFFSLPLTAAVIHTLHFGLLYMSLKFSGAKNLSGSAVARIVGYASAAQLFLIVPPILTFPIGHFFAIMWLFNLEVTGVRTYFGLTFGRAILVVLTPFLFMALFGT